MRAHLSSLDVQLALEGSLPLSEVGHLEQCQRCRERLAQEARLELQLMAASSVEVASERTEALPAAEGPDALWDDISQVRAREAWQKRSHGVWHAVLAIACAVLPWVSMRSQQASGVFAPGSSPASVLSQPWLR